MIIEKPGSPQIGADAVPRMRPPRRSAWRSRRLLLIGLVVLLLGVVALVEIRQQSQPPAPAVTPAAAPLIAHGQILPAQQARVGTLGGGVVQRLDATPGAEVAGQTPLAFVQGPSGTEVVTVPFGGTVTNVLVHAGDTLVPGAAIAVVANLHQLRVETSDVDEFLVGKVAVAQRVQVTVDALDNVALTGTVTNVALLPQTGPNGSTAYPVIIDIGTPPSSVRPGMSVRVTIPDS